MSASGRGGQPGMYTSTGSTSSMPGTTEYESANGPPAIAQLPIAITYFGSGISSYSRMSGGVIFQVSVPATIKRSAWRGHGRNTS